MRNLQKTKFETRNSKQIQITKIQNLKHDTATHNWYLRFEKLIFEIRISIFGFRIYSVYTSCTCNFFRWDNIDQFSFIKTEDLFADLFDQINIVSRDDDCGTLQIDVLK